MTRSRAPAFRRRFVSGTMRQRLTQLLTCSMRTRRRAMRRFAAFWARVRALPRGFLVGMMLSTWSSVNANKPRSWSHRLPTGQGVGHGIRNPLVGDTARIGVTQQENRERRVDQQHIFHRMAFFLTAITARLFKRVLGAREAPFGAIVATRGEVGARTGAAAGSSAGVFSAAVGTTRAAASASVTPTRCASACKERLGASPSVRSVPCSTPHRA